MTNPILLIKSQIYTLLKIRLNAAVEDAELPNLPYSDFSVEYLKDKPFGDFASNIAMVCAKSFKITPEKVAKIILKDANFEQKLIRIGVKSVTFQNGFLNFELSNDFFEHALLEILESFEDYGSVDVGKGQTLLLEYVSANPTGPMHVGNARGGAIGDSLAKILKKANFAVTKEFYINDAGNQIEVFKKSLDARVRQALGELSDSEFPEDGYHGEDVIVLAREFMESAPANFSYLTQNERECALVEYALSKNILDIKKTLEYYRINYDVWFSETSLHANGLVQKTIDMLANKNLIYENDGAIWYRFSGASDNTKDEVLVRANGKYTYFAVDIAYHYDKLVARKFEYAVNIWGADHHGHVERLKNALCDLGIEPSRLTILLMQVVRLVKDGNIVKMSKRTGKAVTLKELLEEVPVDAARFFFTQREVNSHLDFNLDLAVEKSTQNPVYYVQYAHARSCSVLKHASSHPILRKSLQHESETGLLKLLLFYPCVIEIAANNLDPSELNKYLLSLAARFHKFYGECRVVLEDNFVSDLRLYLCKATKQVLKDGLGLLGVCAPEEM